MVGKTRPLGVLAAEGAEAADCVSGSVLTVGSWSRLTERSISRMDGLFGGTMGGLGDREPVKPDAPLETGASFLGTGRETSAADSPAAAAPTPADVSDGAAALAESKFNSVAALAGVPRGDAPHVPVNLLSSGSPERSVGSADASTLLSAGAPA